MLQAVEPRRPLLALRGAGFRVQDSEQVERGEGEEGEGDALGFGGLVVRGEVGFEAAEEVLGVFGVV